MLNCVWWNQGLRSFAGWMRARRMPRYSVLTVDKNQLYGVWDSRRSCRFYMHVAALAEDKQVLRGMSRADRQYIRAVASEVVMPRSVRQTRDGELLTVE